MEVVVKPGRLVEQVQVQVGRRAFVRFALTCDKSCERCQHVGEVAFELREALKRDVRFYDGDDDFLIAEEARMLFGDLCPDARELGVRQGDAC